MTSSTSSKPSVTSPLMRVLAAATCLGLTATLAVGVSTPASAKKKPKLVNLTSKILTVEEVRQATGDPSNLAVQSTIARVSKGSYFRVFSQSEEDTLRYSVGINRVTSSSGGGSGGGGGDTAPPSDMTCEVAEQSAAKNTILCFDEMMVLAFSTWILTSKKVKWNVVAQSTRFLFDFTDGSTIPLTEAIKDAEVASAKAIRDAQKKKAFG